MVELTTQQEDYVIESGMEKYKEWKVEIDEEFEINGAYYNMNWKAISDRKKRKEAKENELIWIEEWIKEQEERVP